MLYRFGDCELDTQLYTLQRRGKPISLRPRVFQVLIYLLEHRQRVVTRQELFEHIWAERFVSDTALESCIKVVRQIIGDRARKPRLLQTMRGYGYRFVADVEVSSALSADTPLQVPASVSPDIHASALAGERKPVTILCCAPALRERRGLDALHRTMRELYDLLRREVQRYGGMIQPVAGDRFLALFGLPVARKITLDAPCWQPSECSSGCRHEQTVWLDQQGSV